jgi:hypothetical protein
VPGQLGAVLWLVEAEDQLDELGQGFRGGGDAPALVRDLVHVHADLTRSLDFQAGPTILAGSKPPWIGSGACTFP